MKNHQDSHAPQFSDLDGVLGSGTGSVLEGERNCSVTFALSAAG